MGSVIWQLTSRRFRLRWTAKKLHTSVQRQTYNEMQDAIKRKAKRILNRAKKMENILYRKKTKKNERRKLAHSHYLCCYFAFASCDFFSRARLLLSLLCITVTSTQWICLVWFGSVQIVSFSPLLCMCMCDTSLFLSPCI